ncbi:hypothetical protein EGW08_009590 [Elysia chlorotica]|uniref:C2 domain-containing protein n=1 Tax=Elysia chlorotica TaxID=188477 RepID=A0A433TM21_ELYCH|nr:hypothetical protein EGW08_009590 [Elysia chlorotica]
MGPSPQHQPSDHQIRKSPAPQYGHSMLEITRAEKGKLEDQVASLREQINMYEMEIENLREQAKLREAGYNEDILAIKRKMTSEQKVNLQENIDMIKLQREVKEKSTMLTALQDKYQQMENSSRAVKQSHDQILREMEHLNLQIQEEQNRNLSLQNELKLGGAHQKKVLELQEQVNDLQRECDVLKEANEKLISSAFDLEQETKWRQRENALKVQIAQLEATLKSDLGEKGSVIDRYAQERDAHEKLQDEYRKLQIEYFTQKEQMDDLNEKMKFFTKESAVDFTEIEEALVLIKQRKQQDQQPPDFLQAVDDELNKDHRKALVELQAEYAETVHELEKTRNMLVVQHKINKDYQSEVNISTSKLDDVKKEYEMKLDEYARLLDIRAARIKKLEAQLRDVAYGTRQYRLPQPDDDVESTMDFDETVSLERGQNLFEIHIEKINLSKDAMEVIGDEDPSLFCTWEFFEFEIISTPVVRGPRPLFDFTSQYIVKVDDFFLHYLQKETCTVELHQSLGQDYSTIAACQMVFRDIFDKPHGRIHGTATLTGVGDGESGIGYGTVDYWIRLRVPMEQALRLFKERTKALGYIMTNERMASQALEALDETAMQRPPDNVNQLHVKVVRCHKLVCRRQNVQPSPYVAYKVLDFPDHATIILRNTNDPEFNDHKIYSVPVTFELDQYIRTAKLQMFVFDDTDPELDSYLGVAEVPLLPLAHDSPVTGQFQLTRGQGKIVAGVIEVELKWQYTYLPPKVAKHMPQELEMAPDDPPTKLGPDSDARPTREELVSPVQPVRQRAKGAKSQPSATSTPIDADKHKAVQDGLVHGQPKPISRRKVHINEEIPETDLKAADQVDDTVSQVVNRFIPNMSESISSSTAPEASTQILPETSHFVSGEPELPLPTPGEESEEGEELTPRPTPPRSSLQIESGSEDSTDFSPPKAKRRQGLSNKGKPQPRARTQLIFSPYVARKTKDLQGHSDKSAPEEEEEDVEEEIEEEVEEEIAQEEETMRDEVHEEEEVEEDEGSARHSQISTESEPVAMESDSEGVMVEQPSTLRKRSKRSKASDNITIVISELTLEEDSPPMLDDNVKQLFVEYHLNGVDPQETETPFSLPKPKPFQANTYNFSKTIAVDLKHHHDRRAYLASMLLPGHPDKGRLKFTVVSEPPQPTGPAESSEMECEDVGVAFVDMKRILMEEKDLKDEQIEIKDVETESAVIGHMVVTVECAEVLKAVASEMQVEGTF